jgi:murein L,D-transpeptidase YcbB/YkuD
MRTGILSAALIALSLQPAVASAKAAPQAVAAAPVQLPYQSANLPTSGQVQAFYAGYHYAPIWFVGATPKAAANELISILQRSPLDGIASGPQYAAQAQAALQQAVATGSPAAIAFADHTLSEALVLYAQMMERPIPGMTYGYDYMKPKPPSATEVLRIAAGAPSLQMYLQQVANPNSIYVGIRDAAWQQMQASGTTAPDPRVVTNLERARGMPAKGRFVLVNAATQMLYMYQNGVPVDSMKVVVGEDEGKLRTPMITSMMFYAVHNPYWNSTDGINEIIARRYLSEGQKYLNWRGYHVMSDWTANATEIPVDKVDWKGIKAGKVSVRIRQDPGPDNSMGVLKFPFANPQDIYLHDSPTRELFAKSNRMLSHGCVRLEDAKRLGTWLMGHTPVAPNDQPEQFEQFARGVPVYLLYLTAQPRDGQLTFVEDRYGWDPAGGHGGTEVAAGK